MQLDLNCDLGEGEPLSRTRALMRSITSANIACGGHAGNLTTMSACVRLAKQYGVRVGAHPGAWNRRDFGRSAVRIEPDELELLLLQQVGALEQVIHSLGLKLHHIKLHGALYHATEADTRLAHSYIASVARWWPRVKIYAQAGGRVAQISRPAKVTVWEEVFADRAYANQGSLVPRGQPGALLTSIGEVLKRAEELLSSGQLRAVSGKPLELAAKTLCLHSDTPGAATMAKALATILTKSSLKR